MTGSEVFDVVVVGGGPSGATAAHDLANLGRNVLLLDRAAVSSRAAAPFRRG